MKRVSFLVIFLCFLHLYAEKISLTIAYEDKEQPPYYMKNSLEVPRENPGVCVEMVLLLEKYIPEVEIKLIRMPWKRCVMTLGENSIDGIFNSSYVKERLALGCYPTINRDLLGQVDKERRLTTISYYFYVLRNSDFKWNGDFQEIKTVIGAPTGYSIINDLHTKGIVVEEAQDSFKNLQKLIKQRLSAVALQDVTADAIIKENRALFKDVMKINPPLAKKDYYLMLSRKFVEKNPKLAQKIWDTIKIIREKKYKSISAKYIKL